MDRLRPLLNVAFRDLLDEVPPDKLQDSALLTIMAVLVAERDRLYNGGGEIAVVPLHLVVMPEIVSTQQSC